MAVAQRKNGANTKSTPLVRAVVARGLGPEHAPKKSLGRYGFAVRSNLRGD
jgi:hypothetical protein